MNLRQLKTGFAEQLDGRYPATEVESFFNLLAKEYLKKDRLQIALDPAAKVGESQQAEFENALHRLKKHEPIQYILGNSCFFGLDFTVNSNVLIPRPETEELVAWIIKEYGMNDRSSTIKILDIGTGSGCIAISLAKNLSRSAVFALDISVGALETAKRNAERNLANVEFLRSDVLKMEKLPRDFDVIVSNPPYVRQMEKTGMARNVLENEPELALYVKDGDPLVFYKKIAELAKAQLTENGAVYVECNQYLTEDTEQIFMDNGFKTRVRKDIFGNNRMLKGVLPS